MTTQNIQAKTNPAGWVIAAILLPFIVGTLYLYFSRWPVRWFNGTTDVLALAVSLGIGTALLAMMPTRPLARTVALVNYVPAAAVSLFLFNFAFVAFVFGDGL